MDPNNPIKINNGGKILSKKTQNKKMSKTKKTANNSVSNSNTIITQALTFSVMEAQLDNKAIGIISVVSRTKYIEIPSTPK